ncbi:hypothetical protein [Candidatus Igneacidithiobacillus taiwanensis]|uniref:hypothetical protein n=1 Tax=Candidatus Igneacidithiobacillus taiwanensis TaxID=1945924 RepID=UPI0028A20A72|nr:hypothetical protein [Candidatus Igneacidithiobacillus taiwanensis]
MTDTRQAIGQLFEAVPELTEATLTADGIQYRARRNGPWLLVDKKEPGRRGWQPWTELRKRVTI